MDCLANPSIVPKGRWEKAKQSKSRFRRHFHHRRRTHSPVDKQQWSEEGLTRARPHRAAPKPVRISRIIIGCPKAKRELQVNTAIAVFNKIDPSPTCRCSRPRMASVLALFAPFCSANRPWTSTYTMDARKTARSNLTRLPSTMSACAPRKGERANERSSRYLRYFPSFLDAIVIST